MDVAKIRQAMISARSVLITAYNEEYQERNAEVRKRVLERNINRLTEALEEFDKAAAA